MPLGDFKKSQPSMPKREEVVKDDNTIYAADVYNENLANENTDKVKVRKNIKPIQQKGKAYPTMLPESEFEGDTPTLNMEIDDLNLNQEISRYIRDLDDTNPVKLRRKGLL